MKCIPSGASRRKLPEPHPGSSTVASSRHAEASQGLEHRRMTVGEV